MIEARLTMRPATPSASIERRTYLLNRIGETTLSRTACSIWAALVSASVPSTLMPALFTSAETGPRSFRSCLTSAAMPSVWARSYAVKPTEPVPLRAASSMVWRSSGLSLRAIAITLWLDLHGRRTMPRPMPRLPPVTMTLPMTAYQLSCVRDGQRGDKADCRRHLVRRQRLTAELLYGLLQFARLFSLG